MEKKKERVELVATIGEYGAEPGAVVPVDNSRLDRIKSADPDEHQAKFATIAVESGISKNKRHWPGRILEKIGEQIRAKEPVGYRGHPLLKKDFDKGADFPDPQTVWLGATTTLDGGNTKLFVKGYNLKDKPIRTELLSGAVDSVSICGDATMVPAKGGVWNVEEFELETIDWSRKGGQGMVGRVVALTGEQEEIQEEEGSEGIVKPEDIAALTETDLKRYNPDLHAAVMAQGSEDEELATKVGEQDEKIKKAEPVLEESKTVREKLGLKEDESLLDAVTNLISNARAGLKEEFKTHVTSQLEKKLKGDENKPIRELVAQLVGEMKDDDEAEDEEAVHKLAEERVNATLDSNESVKKLVAEMDEGEGETRPNLKQREGERKPRESANIERTEVSV